MPGPSRNEGVAAHRVRVGSSGRATIDRGLSPAGDRWPGVRPVRSFLPRSVFGVAVLRQPRQLVALALVALLLVSALVSLGPGRLSRAREPAVVDALTERPAPPPALIRTPIAPCVPGKAPASAATGVLSVNAVGTGVWATGNLTRLENNSGMNATLPVPRGSPALNQFIVVAIADFLNATSAVAVGVAETGVPFLGVLAVPVAFLPNGTEVYSSSGPYLTVGASYDFEIAHTQGGWWNLTYGGKKITGSAAWENGSYDLGVSSAAGVTCASGVRTAPALLVALYGNGVAPPSLPVTRVPRSIGIAPNGSSTFSYEPTSANALPQFNASLGTLDLAGHDQNASLPSGTLVVGSNASFGYPGANASVWGSYEVRAVAGLNVSPGPGNLAPGASEVLNATATDAQGVPIANASFDWQLVPSSLGTLNATHGDSVVFTAGTVPESGSIWVNASYNCTGRAWRSNVTVTTASGPPILSFTAAPAAVEVGEAANLSVTLGSWSGPVAFAYSGLPVPCRTEDVSLLACTPGAPGSFPVTVWANGSTGASSNATTQLTVDPVLAISGFFAAPGTIPEGGTARFQANVSGGVPPISYTIVGLPSGCGAPSDPVNFTCSPGPVYGSFEVRLYANDSAGHSATAVAPLTITQPTPVAFVVHLSATPNPVVVGQTTHLVATLTGGSGVDTFVYAALPPGCTTSNLSNLACLPSVAGDFSVTVSVTDASGAVARGNLTLTVDPLPSSSSSSTRELGWGFYAVVVGGAAVAVAAASLWLVRRRRLRR